MKFEKYIRVKNEQKDFLVGTSSSNIIIKNIVEKIFKIENGNIIIGNDAIELERLYLNKVNLDENIICSVEKEISLLHKKIQLMVKNKEEQLEFIDNKIKEIKEAIDYAIGLRNKSVYDVIGVINNSFSNIITKNIIFSDNLNTFNGKYSFLSGERTILENNSYEIIEHSANYKLEIKLKNRNFINYIMFNDSLKTIDTFKVQFLDSNTTVKEIKEVDINISPLITANISCNRVVIEGVGAREIVSNFKICVGKNNYNYNRAISVYECDFSNNKLSENFLFKCNDDIKIFLYPKKEFVLDESLTYQEFKEKYYLIENIVRTDISSAVNLQDNYIMCFLETNNDILQELKIYGVD